MTTTVVQKQEQTAPGGGVASWRIADLKPSPFNHRRDLGDLVELTASINP